jgi:hypothetical protein
LQDLAKEQLQLQLKKQQEKPAQHEQQLPAPR